MSLKVSNLRSSHYLIIKSRRLDMAYNKENFHYIQLTGERYVRCLSSICLILVLLVWYATFTGI